MEVTLIQYVGSDQMVADAARVSTDRDQDTGRPIEGLIKYLARAGHASPFEHCHATFMVEAPLFVRDQWVRHRTQSYNALSLRYTASKHDYYYPPPSRPLVNAGTKAHPEFVKPPTQTQYTLAIDTMRGAFDAAKEAYEALLAQGVAEEVARNVLPEATMTRFYTTANLRNWVAFIKERTADNAQWEIKELALQIKAELLELFPISAKALLAPNP